MGKGMRCIQKGRCVCRHIMDTMNRMVHDCAYYLLSIGVKKNDKVALFSPNRYEWWVASQASFPSVRKRSDIRNELTGRGSVYYR